MKIKRFLKFIESIEYDDYDNEIDDDSHVGLAYDKHGRYQRNYGRPIPETEFVDMHDEIKTVFDDIIDLGSQYSVDYDKRWTCTIVTITLHKSLFKDVPRLPGESIRSIRRIDRITEMISKFCDEEIVYRLERVEDLFNSPATPAIEHILKVKDDKDRIYLYPGHKYVYITECRAGQRDFTPDKEGSFQVTFGFANFAKELPIGVKAKPQLQLDDEGRYIPGKFVEKR